jgi:hypothetical protein
MNKSNITLMMLLPIYLIVSGCSFSESSKSFSKSSKSISKSISSPSRWLIRSSKKGGDTTETTSYSYQDEVVALTILYTKSGRTSQDFQRELSMVSNNHGIVDWGNNTQTYRSIGIGLKRGGISDKSIKTLSFLQTKYFFDHYTQILSGYNLSNNAS